MKKQYRLMELDCAGCAAKMEHAIANLPGVNSVTVSFMTQKLTVDIPDEREQELLDEMKRIIRKIDPDCCIVE